MSDGTLSQDDINEILDMVDKNARRKKPLLGLIPKNIIQINRVEQIINAIQRYLNCGEIIPDEWTSELTDLIYDINYYREERKKVEKTGSVNYTKLSSTELLQACGDDASKWAEAFMQINISGDSKKRDNIDFGVMVGWFANAIEHSCDVRRQRA